MSSYESIDCKSLPRVSPECLSLSHHFQDAGQRDLIAMYASALGDNAVERYAMFLVSVALSADVVERRLALARAKDHGLDMERVAVATAERTVEKALDVRARCFVAVCPGSNLFADTSAAQRPTSIIDCATTRGIRGGIVPSPIHRMDNVL